MSICRLEIQTVSTYLVLMPERAFSSLTGSYLTPSTVYDIDGIIQLAPLNCQNETRSPIAYTKCACVPIS